VVVHELGPSEGKVSQRALKLRALSADAWDTCPVVLVTNYEALDQEVMKNAVQEISWDLVVLDESHRIKAPTGVRSKFLGKLGRSVSRRLILTGTPNADKPIDVWGQFRFLEPSIFGNYGEFKRQYCHLTLMPNGQGGYFEKIEGYKNLDDLASRMASIAFRVTSDVLDLPEQHDIVRSVRLGDEGRKIYARMEKDALASVEEETDVIASNVLTRYLRLQEITSGYIRSDEVGGNEPRKIRRFDTAKADATLEIIEGIGEDEPVVIFYRFTQDAEILGQLLMDRKIPWYELSGRRNDLALWKERGERKEISGGGGVLLVQVASGSEAIDLTAARYVIYYSTDFSLSHYEQSRKRVHRPGQTRPVTYYHIQAEGTVDEYIWNALQSKSDIATTISGHILAKHGKGESNENSIRSAGEANHARVAR
jgi:SNF2 family DNA or RNA helicase